MIVLAAFSSLRRRHSRVCVDHRADRTRRDQMSAVRRSRWLGWLTWLEPTRLPRAPNPG